MSEPSLYKPPADLTISAPVNPNTVNDSEGVATTVSPTGEPRVKPSSVPWLVAALVSASAGLELCAQAFPDPKVQLGCRIGAVVVAGFLGVISPGWRKP